MGWGGGSTNIFSFCDTQEMLKLTFVICDNRRRCEKIYRLGAGRGKYGWTGDVDTGKYEVMRGALRNVGCIGFIN